MYFTANEKTALFIDGPNLYATAKSLGFELDFTRLLTLFRGRCHLLRASYYTVLLEEGRHSTLRPLVDWLDYNGFNVVTKPMKDFGGEHGHARAKSSIDVELVVDAMVMARYVDHIVLFTGDGDFCALVEALQDKGKRVSVVSTLRTERGAIADTLHRRADQFIDLADLEPSICRRS